MTRAFPLLIEFRNVIYTARFTAALPAYLLAAITMATCLHAPSARAAEGLASEPYTVFVAYEEAHARCGPSTEYYRTDPLRHGQSLKVFVETEDGWLGVQPPENSFCWIPASDVETANRGQDGVITEDRSVAWIGTHLGRAKRYRWQVQLAEGEPVTIIGRSERDGPDGPQLWYRVVPPSGEFRWVHRDQVARSAEELIAMTNKRRPNPIRPAVSERVAEIMRPRDTHRSADGDVKQALGRSILQRDESPETRTPRVASVRPAAASPRPSTQNDRVRSKAQGKASSRRTFDQLQPVGSEQPVLSSAPTPRNQPRVAANNPRPATAAHATVAPADTLQAAVGSGLNEQWRKNPVRESVAPGTHAPGTHAPVTHAPGTHASAPAPTNQQATVPFQPINRAPSIKQAQHAAPPQSMYQAPADASAEFVSRPRLIDIGSTGSAATPTTLDQATDSNWIIGAARNSMPNAHPGTQAGSSIALVGGQSPNPYRSVGYNSQNVTSQDARGQNVQNAGAKTASAERIAAITNEARDADVERLHLMLSRLMASSATAVETQPIADAADRVSRTSTSDLTIARSRLLSERVAQYQRIAVRRDGNVQVTSNVIQASTISAYDPNTGTSNDSGTIANAYAEPSARQDAGSLGRPTPAPVLPAATGYLVQVYSARPSSPPYALTDRVGNTIAYVTPVPGVNLRPHINNQISVVGNQGYVQGLNTPHIMVSEAVRAAE